MILELVWHREDIQGLSRSPYKSYTSSWMFPRPCEGEPLGLRVGYFLPP